MIFLYFNLISDYSTYKFCYENFKDIYSFRYFTIIKHGWTNSPLEIALKEFLPYSDAKIDYNFKYEYNGADYEYIFTRIEGTNYYIYVVEYKSYPIIKTYGCLISRDIEYKSNS